MPALQTLLARALVRLAIAAAPADMAGKLREIITPAGGGGGPKPVK